MSSQKGFAQVLILLFLLVGLGLAVYLVQTQTNLFPKAFLSQPISAPIPLVPPSSTPVITASATPAPMGGSSRGGGGSLAPITRTIKYFRVAEDPTLFPNTWASYYPGISTSFEFKNATLDKPSFVFVQFADAQYQIIPINGQSYLTSASIQLIEQVSCSSISVQGSGGPYSASATFKGNPASLKIWVASNSEVGQPASSVKSWSQIKEIANPVSGSAYSFSTIGLSAGTHAVLVSLHDSSGNMLDGNLGGVIDNNCTSSLNIATSGTTPTTTPVSSEACKLDCKACPAISDRCGNTTYDSCDYSTCTSPDATYHCQAVDNSNCGGTYRCGNLCGG